jgi:diaminohydroxyphosphoribosylaminopyrimidine deaminase/5-amino-6-(5-phosphoribosylamino)uracil reductase
LAETPGRTVILSTRQPQAVLPGVEIVLLPADRARRLDLAAVIGWLAGEAFNEVLFECGPTLSGALLREQLIDEWLIYMAPVVLGDRGRGLFHMPELTRMANRFELPLQEIRRIGRDVRLRLAGAGNVTPERSDDGR